LKRICASSWKITKNHYLSGQLVVTSEGVKTAACYTLTDVLITNADKVL